MESIFRSEESGLQREFHPHELSLESREVFGLIPAIIQDRFHPTDNDGSLTSIRCDYRGCPRRCVSTPTGIHCRWADRLLSSLVERRKGPTNC